MMCRFGLFAGASDFCSYLISVALPQGQPIIPAPEKTKEKGTTVQAEFVNDYTIEVTNGSNNSSFEVIHNDLKFLDSDKKRRIWDIDVSPNDELIATAGRDCTARLWNGKTGKLLWIHNQQNGYVWSVCFSPDSKLVAIGNYSDAVLVFNVTTIALGLYWTNFLKWHSKRCRS